MIPLCKNCRWFDPQIVTDSGHTLRASCNCPKDEYEVSNSDSIPVTGEPRVMTHSNHLYCEELRSYVWPFDVFAKACGRRGRWFEKAQWSDDAE